MNRTTFEQRTQFYVTSEWQALRESIVFRDGAQCRNCGHPETLEVHHWLPEHDYAGTHDRSGYGLGSNPLLVHPSGLVTLCKACHAALTTVRTDRALKRDPRDKALKQNIFQLWALAGKQIPFRAIKETWSGRAGQYMLVEKVQISKWPYGVAWGRYCIGGKPSEQQKIANAGTYTWSFYSHGGDN